MGSVGKSATPLQTETPPPPIIKENTSKMEPIQSHNPSGTYTNYEEDCTLTSAKQNDEPRQAIVRTNLTGIG